MGKVRFFTKSKRNSIAYVPQSDYLNLYLTPRESLFFSSWFKNSKQADIDHAKLVDRTIEQFGLKCCAGTLIRKCSGGEKKRISIALEMISSPNLLLIDELTSGLDSSTAFKCIEVMQSFIRSGDMSQRPMIIMTIHQPSTDIFNLFDKIYVLANGFCLYEGTPMQLVDYLSSFQLFCPTYFNPAEFMLNVASNFFGNLAVQELKGAYRTSRKSAITPLPHLQRVKRAKLEQKTSFLLGTWLLIRSMFISNFRDPQQSIFRILENILFPALLIFLVRTSSGNESGCIFILQNETHILTETIYQRIDRQRIAITNITILYFNALFLFFVTMTPGVLTFPLKVKVFTKERLNNWYSTSSFFAAFVITNGIFTIFFTSVGTIGFTLLTRQPIALLPQTLLLNILLTLYGDLLAFIISIILPHDLLSAAICTAAFACVSQLFSGFIVRPQDTRSIAIPLSYTSVFRYYFHGLMKVYYLRSDCIIGEDKLFSFTQLLDLIKFYNYNNNETHVNLFENINMKVLMNLEDTWWNRTRIFESIETTTEDFESIIDALHKFWIEKSSFVIQEFGVDLNSWWFDTSILMAMLIFNYLLALILLNWSQKYRKKLN
ncbi:ABC protein: subfamily ABCG-like protein [Dinothrombium tinctorium]|uniref:ABC protein: subfamily ABCG-like protein n=1 Tax=Dinothrombium tinctorium TaxID=1965070 RepID=A0A443QL97_9ACAR|nr:ABC protein: subfamily ABCG-like protein [Dinothrombium tinctorium]